MTSPTLRALAALDVVLTAADPARLDAPTPGGVAAGDRCPDPGWAGR